MNILFPQLMLNIEFRENLQYEIVIENADAFSDVTRDLFSQTNSGEGTVVLSQNNAEIKIAKSCEMIWNPFSVDINNKRILSVIYQEMQDVCKTDILENSGRINTEIVNYIDSIIEKMVYTLSFDYEMDYIGLFKSYNIRLDSSADSLLEGLIKYIKVVKNILRLELFVFVNLKQFLSIEEIEELYKCATYEKIRILIISGTQTYYCDNEKVYVVDKDMCLIELN